jgi:hypothetical protein
MLDQECGREASPCWVRRVFLADGGASKLKGMLEKGKVHPCTGTEALYRPYGL